MKGLSSRRVLVVEDSALIALDLEQTLLDCGVTVVGPFGSVRGALPFAGNGLDAAVLDINLGEEDVFPVADALADAGIAFMFLTGHSDSKLPARHRGRPVVRKPYSPSQLATMLLSLMTKAKKTA
jgi:CheY-like chemotaxis protein